MKTATFKLPTLLGLMGLTLGTYAQTNKDNKTCIKINIVENGKVTKIDTCFQNLDTKDIQQALKNMGVPDMDELNKDMGDVNVIIDTAEGKDGKTEKVIVSAGDGKGGKAEVKVISDKNGESTVSVNGDGNDEGENESYSYSMSDDDKGKEKVIVKSSKNGSCTIIVNEDDNSTTPKDAKKVKVYVFKKMEIKDVTSDDKKNLPKGVANSMNGAQPFDNLVMAPNPTDGNIHITYKSGSDEPLEIKVYDTQGKTVYSETSTNIGDSIDKTISLGNVGKGIYFVQLVQGKQMEVRKVVVK
jgi:hypothetical protein